MTVMLYTSRVILYTLGVEDYGIYNVVAGFVALLGFLLGAMSTATQRFLSFELAKNTDRNMSSIFSMSLNIHIAIAILVFLLAETIGLWFLNHKLNIPLDRIRASQWVYHLSALSFVITIISVPYNALIIAHEKMTVFAWVSIVDVCLKLLIVFMLTWFEKDKLILYGILNLAVALIIFIVYWIYCRKTYQEARFKIYWNRLLFQTMLTFTGWNLWGNIASVLSGQGVNILLNIFFGPTVNAARAIAMQVSAALKQFVQNVQIAVNPQIIKSYASNDMDYMHNLVIIGAKYNYLILALLSAPVFINTDIILKLWLENVPEYSSIFLRLIIVNILIDSISSPLMTSAQATGNIKTYQSVVGGLQLFNIPASYLVLKFGSNPESVIYVSIIISLVALIARLAILRNMISLPIKRYLKNVVGRCTLVTITVTVLYKLLWASSISSFNFILQSICILFISLITISIIGVSKSERIWISNISKNIFKKMVIR